MVRRLLALVASALLGLTACSPAPSASPAASQPGSASASSATPSPSVDPARVGLGDCTGPLNLSGASMADVEVLSCDQPHFYEAFATVPMAPGEYPGVDALAAQARTECATAFTDFVGVSPEYSRFSSAYLAPDATAWPLLESPALTCLVGSAKGGLIGSAKGDTRIFPAKGQCTGPQDVAALDVEILDCADRHHYEVYAVKQIDAKKAPTGKALDKLIDSVCVSGFKKFVGIDATRSRYEYLYFLASADLWSKVGDHRLVCSVGLAKGGIKGTLKGKKK